MNSIDLLCPFEDCEGVFINPVTLTCCHLDICQEHLFELVKENSDGCIILNCCFCKKQTQISDDSKLSINKKKIAEINIRLGEKYKESKDTLEKLLEKAVELTDLKKDSNKIIDDYFSQIEQDIERGRKEDKKLIDSFYDSLLKDLSIYKKTCEENGHKNRKLIEEEIQVFEEEYEKYKFELKQYIIDDWRWQVLNNQIGNHLNHLKKKIKKIENVFMNYMTIEFKKSNQDLEKSLGKLEISNNSIMKYDLITASPDFSVSIWDLNSRAREKCLEDHVNTVGFVEFISRYKMLTSSNDQAIKLWCTITGECIKTFNSSGSIASFLLRLNEEEFISGHEYGGIHFRNIYKPIPFKSLLSHTKKISCLELIPSRNQLVSSCSDFVKIWNLDNNECMVSIQNSPNISIIERFKLSEDYSSVFIYSDNNSIRNIDLQSYKSTIMLEEYSKEMMPIDFIPGNLVAQVIENNTIKITDLNGKCKERILQGHKGFITRVKFFKIDVLSSESSDGVIKIWDLNKIECVFSFDTTTVSSLNDIYIFE